MDPTDLLSTPALAQLVATAARTADRASLVAAAHAMGVTVPFAAIGDRPVAWQLDPLVASFATAIGYAVSQGGSLDEAHQAFRLSAIMSAVRGLVGKYYDADGNWNHDDHVRTAETDAIRDALRAAEAAL